MWARLLLLHYPQSDDPSEAASLGTPTGEEFDTFGSAACWPSLL
jgi:hypothetical protein